MGSALAGIVPLMKSSFRGKCFVSASSSDICCAVTTRIGSTYYVIPFYYKCCMRGGGHGGKVFQNPTVLVYLFHRDVFQVSLIFYLPLLFYSYSGVRFRV